MVGTEAAGCYSDVLWVLTRHCYSSNRFVCFARAVQSLQSLTMNEPWTNATRPPAPLKHFHCGAQAYNIRQIFEISNTSSGILIRFVSWMRTQSTLISADVKTFISFFLLDWQRKVEIGPDAKVLRRPPIFYRKCSNRHVDWGSVQLPEESWSPIGEIHIICLWYQNYTRYGTAP